MLIVATNAIVPRLAWLKRHSKKRDAVISTSGGILRIQAGPLDVAVPCTGSLPHALAFDTSVFRALISVPLTTETIEISYADGLVIVGGIKAQAEKADVVEIEPLPVSVTGQLALEF